MKSEGYAEIKYRLCGGGGKLFYLLKFSDFGSLTYCQNTFGSVPDHSRLIFSLWRIKMNMAMITEHPVITGERVASHKITGNTPKEANEATEALLNQQINMIKTNIAIKNDTGEITRKQPPAVATPFPPFLNFMKIGYRCPIKAENAITDIYSSFQILGTSIPGKIR